MAPSVDCKTSSSHENLHRSCNSDSYIFNALRSQLRRSAMKTWKISIFLFLTCQNNFSNGDLGSEIRRHVNQQLSHLQYLGDDIRREVNRNLAPVHALKIKANMRNGVGGVTTVTYSGKQGRNFIIRNGERFVCYGNFRGPECHGTLEPFTFKSNQDLCFSNSFAAVNNQICLSNSPISVQISNNKALCNAFDGSPILVLTETEYDQMCGDVAYFVYYSNPNDPLAIPIPNANPHVNCLNNEPGICHFKETANVNHGNVASHFSNSFSYNYHSR